MLTWLENPVWRVGTFSAAAFFSFALAIAISFPDEQIKEIATVKIEKAVGAKYKVRIDDLDIWRLSGARLEGVQIEERITEPAEPVDEDAPADLPMKVRISSIGARLAPIASLFNLAPTVAFEIDVDGGVISGTAAVGTTTRVEATFNDLDLRQTPSLTSFTGIPFFGELSGDIDLLLDKGMRPTEGHVRFAGSQLTLGPATVMTEKFPPMTYFEIPQTNFGTLAVNMEMEAGEKKSGVLNIRKFETSGRDIRLEAWGDVATTNNVGRARPNVQMRLQLDDTFVKKNNLAPLLNVNEFRKGKAKDWYGFALTGSVEKIQFKGSPTAANGPATAKPDAKATDEKP